MILRIRSFTVSDDKGFYHCFGCGAHGTAIGFLMNYEAFEFPDAVEELARLVGLEVPREAASGPRPTEGLYELMTAAAAWYQEQLRQSAGAKESRRLPNSTRSKALRGLST